MEGFATLTGDDCETLSLPVLGFYGDWFAAENIIDAPMYTGESVYMTQGMLSTSVAAGDIFAGMNEAGWIRVTRMKSRTGVHLLLSQRRS